MENALYEITSMRLISDLSLDNPIPTHTHHESDTYYLWNTETSPRHFLKKVE